MQKSQGLASCTLRGASRLTGSSTRVYGAAMAWITSRLARAIALTDYFAFSLSIGPVTVAEPIPNNSIRLSCSSTLSWITIAHPTSITISEDGMSSRREICKEVAQARDTVARINDRGCRPKPLFNPHPPNFISYQTPHNCLHRSDDHQILQLILISLCITLCPQLILLPAPPPPPTTPIRPLWIHLLMPGPERL